MADEVGVANQVVDAVAHVGRKVQAQQPHGGPVAPQNLVAGVQDDAAVMQCPGGLPDLPHQTAITFPSFARLGPQPDNDREKLRPESPGRGRNGRTLFQRPVEVVEISQRDGQIKSQRPDEPPGRIAQPDSREERKRQPCSGIDEMRYPPIR